MGVIYLLSARSLRFLSLLGLTAIGLLSTAAKPAFSAESITITYGILEFPVRVDSLETYAETGRVNPDLRTYLRFLNPQERSDLQDFLQQRFEVSPVTVSRITYSPLGEGTLRKLGRVIRTDARLDGFYALRSALILAADQPNGTSIIDILRLYPSPRIRIDARAALALKREFVTTVAYRDAAVRAITQQAEAEIAADGLDVSQLPSLLQTGSFQITRQTLQLQRDRQTVTGDRIERRFRVELYLPDSPEPAPVLVISHGLGSSPDAFDYLGEFLASHGFAVVIPQHIGSDADRAQAFAAGILSSNVNPVEFIDRPLDIRYMLDALEEQSVTDPALRGRMNLQQVGAIGHSFGGYAVLALAGANLNIDRIRQVCADPPLSLNTSPTLQCLADRLPDFPYPLGDSRIQAVIAISPINSILLGPESISTIQIPTFMIGGSNDFIASVVEEQIHPFLWLTAPDKYLALIIPSSHTQADATDAEGSTLPADLLNLLSGPDPDLGRHYLMELSLAFMQTHLNQRPEFAPYLSANYARSISQDPLTLRLVRSLTAEQLEQAFGRTPPIPIFPQLATSNIPQRSTPILAEIAQTGILKASINTEAIPFGSLENGQPTGFCVDVLQTFAEQLQTQLERSVQLEIVPLPAVQPSFELVQNDAVHLECGPNVIQNQIPSIAFSTPFFLTGNQFILSSDRQAEVNPLSSLSGVRVGVDQASVSDRFLQTRYPNAEIVSFEGLGSISAGLQALTSGEIDTFLGDGILLVAEANQQNLLSAGYTLVPSSPLTCDPYGFVLPANDVQWQTTVNDFVVSPAFRSVWNSWFQENIPYIFLGLDFCAS
jgi:predicted dienelactone hydrolase/ABC-type amino acid transport substrate-binding protein